MDLPPSTDAVFKRLDRDAGISMVAMVQAHRATCLICRGVTREPDPELPLAGLAESCRIHVLEGMGRLAFITLSCMSEAIEQHTQLIQQLQRHEDGIRQAIDRVVALETKMADVLGAITKGL